MLIAITRKVSPAIAKCELTHLQRIPIDLARAEQQHAAYENCLRGLGCDVRSLPAEPALADSVFVEDAALVVDELAVILRPGAESRRAETVSIAAALKPFRKLASIEAPATVDGGDVLRVGKRVFVGMTSRSNEAAIHQMQTILGPLGYRVEGVAVRGCLHLKSAATQIGDNILLVNPKWVEKKVFEGMECVEIDPSEPYAANAVVVGDAVLYSASFPETRALLEKRGIRLVTVDASELAKAEGALTCCSLIFRN
jgi:dimethylargininase